MKPFRVLFCVLAIALPTLRAADGRAAEGCWTAEAAQAFQCTGKSTTLDLSRKGPGASLPNPTKANEPKKTHSATRPTAPPAAPTVDPRIVMQAKLKPRLRDLLMQEIRGLESLLESTKRNSPDRAQILKRLADDYAELEAASLRDKTEAEIKKNKPEVDRMNRVILNARQSAIRYYTTIKDQYPSYSKLDEAIYYLAYEYEQAADSAGALAAYHELIQKVPTSRYVPSAYLAFGELFFSQAQGDPSKFDLARQAYQEVVKYPPPDNKMFGYAHYKIAYVYWNQGDLDPQNYARAIQHFKEAIRYGQQYPQLPNAAQIAVSARKDMIPVYALAGRPDKAFELFKDLSGDKPGEVVHAIKMLDDLGQNYLDTGHYPEAITLYQDLMKRDHGPRFCRYHSHISEATLALRSGAKDRIQEVLDAQLGVQKEFRASQQPADEKLRCANDTAGLLTETAMAWHLEAVGSHGVRGTNDAKTMALATQLYKKVVDNFTSTEFARFEFPHIVKEDWPSIFKVRYAMADLMYHQKKWDDCGPAFDAVAAENPDSPEAAEALYAAALCYQNVYLQRHRGGSDRRGTGNMPGQNARQSTSDSAKFAPVAFDDVEKRMVKAFQRFICHVKPADTDKEGKDKQVEVKYAWSRTQFEAHHWDEAATGFRDIAIHHPDHEAGIFASQLYLESANIMATRAEPKRPGCFRAMEEDVSTFLRLYCTGDRAKGNEDSCKRFGVVQADVQRWGAEAAVKRADELLDKGKPLEAYPIYQQAAEDFMKIWKHYGEEPIKAGKGPQAERLDEILHNAARAYQAAHLLAKAIGVRMILVDAQWGMASTPLARKAVYDIGANYQAIAVYDQAAEWYERYAKDSPSSENSDVALSDAVVLRLGLGQEAKAIDDAKQFAQSFGARKPVHNAQIAFAVAAHYVEQKSWQQARDRLTAAMRMIDTNATYDVRVQAHAMLGRVYVQLKSTSNAEGEYRKARELWNDQAAVAKFLKDAADDPRKVGKTLTAVGEAWFFFAEQQRIRTVEPLRFPVYADTGYAGSSKPFEQMDSQEFAADKAKRDAESAKVMKHITSKVKPWVESKSKAIEAAEAEYKKILELKPIPPPRWVIAAASRVGTMWGGFVADFRRAPIPKWMEKDPEARGAYTGGLDQVSEPIKLRAKSAFQACLERSVQHQYFDEYSRACEEWLARNYKSEYHLVDEFRSAPNQVGSGLNDKPYPLSIGGQPVVLPAVLKPEERKRP
ncbi:MAG: tetratricopeptide repeat protein [Deltaproteobacteria bacterium]|nr:tetratricopeptide repeat protein [Deltaproteobacteria bacterium]